MYETEYKRKFLVVIDESPECERALTFAAYRVKRTGGTVVLMSVIPKPEFIGMGVEDVLRAEAVEDAERNLDARLARIRDIGDVRSESVIREGEGPEEIEKVIDADRDIAILVLAAGSAKDGPGPLVSSIAGRAAAFPIPVTVLPDSLTNEEIDALC